MSRALDSDPRHRDIHTAHFSAVGAKNLAESGLKVRMLLAARTDLAGVFAREHPDAKRDVVAAATWFTSQPMQ